MKRIIALLIFICALLSAVACASKEITVYKPSQSDTLNNSTYFSDTSSLDKTESSYTASKYNSYQADVSNSSVVSQNTFSVASELEYLMPTGDTLNFVIIDKKVNIIIDERYLGAVTAPEPDGFGKYKVTVKLDNEGTERFATATALNIDKEIIVIVNNMTVYRAVVPAPITDGYLEMNGYSTYEEANRVYQSISNIMLGIK